MKVFIDAGHNFSGYDTGAQGNGLREQDITFIIANKLKSLFVNNGHQVKMSRNNLSDNIGKDTANSLDLRCYMANEWGADLFVSIHCNAHDNIDANGTEVYAYKLDSVAGNYAKSIQKSLIDKLQTRNRGAKEYGWKVLKKTNMPAVLIETAFITNVEDAKKLANNSDDFAEAIYEGITGQSANKEITEVLDIVYELAERGIITNEKLWINKLKEDTNSYWLARKCVNYIREINV